MVVLSRDERRRRVLELHNQGKGTREISEILQMSFRDIGPILRDADREKDAEQQRTRHAFLSSEAYKLYSQGVSPVQVAIELNLRAPEANMFLREYWELAGLHQLNQIYEEVKINPWPLVNLYRSIRAACMEMSHVITLLKLANNDLPSVQHKYNFLEQEVISLQEQKTNLYNQLTLEGSNLEYYRVQSQKAIERFEVLQERTKKAESLVTHFENNNQEYVKIKNNIEEKLRDRLFNRRWLLRLAALCITESIRENPEKYRYLIHQGGRPSTMDCTAPDFSPFWMNEQHQQYNQLNVFMEDYVAMLIEDGERLMENLVDELGHEIIESYTNKSPQPSSPSLPETESKSIREPSADEVTISRYEAS